MKNETAPDVVQQKYKDLGAPMAYQWRVQEAKAYGVTVVPYIDARDVADRLDEVLGPENWQADYKQIKQAVYCGIGVRVGDDWVWKWDAGAESNIEKEKGEASDSFKRAATKWRVGRFLYDLSYYKLKAFVKPAAGAQKEKIYPADGNGNPIYDKKALSEYVNKLRGAPTPPPQPKPSLLLDTDLYREAEKYVRSKSFSVSQVKKKYQMTKDVEASLEAAYKEGILKLAERNGHDDLVDLTTVQVDTDTGEIIQ